MHCQHNLKILLQNQERYGKIKNMQEIIKQICEAEEKAAEIKADAYAKAAEIALNAEERAADIQKLAEADCKALREKTLKDAAEEAQKRYDSDITVNRAKASKYCSDRLKNTDKIVNDIVRRIKSGSC